MKPGRKRKGDKERLVGGERRREEEREGCVKEQIEEQGLNLRRS